MIDVLFLLLWVAFAALVVAIYIWLSTGLLARLKQRPNRQDLSELTLFERLAGATRISKCTRAALAFSAVTAFTHITLLLKALCWLSEPEKKFWRGLLALQTAFIAIGVPAIVSFHIASKSSSSLPLLISRAAALVALWILLALVPGRLVSFTKNYSDTNTSVLLNLCNFALSRIHVLGVTVSAAFSAASAVLTLYDRYLAPSLSQQATAARISGIKQNIDYHRSMLQEKYDELDRITQQNQSDGTSDSLATSALDFVKRRLNSADRDGSFPQSVRTRSRSRNEESSSMWPLSMLGFKSNKTKELKTEIHALELVTLDLEVLHAAAVNARRRTLRAQTAIGHVLTAVDAVFALYCIYSITFTSVTFLRLYRAMPWQILRRLFSPKDSSGADSTVEFGGPGDPLSRFVAAALAHIANNQSSAAKYLNAAQYSMSTLLIVAGANTMLRLFARTLRVLPKAISFDNILSLSSGLACTYIMSLVLVFEGDSTRNGPYPLQPLRALVEPKDLLKTSVSIYVFCAVVTIATVVFNRVWSGTDYLDDFEDVEQGLPVAKDD